MADVKKFKFVSPGIFINEIDNSQIPREPEAMGPVIIGRAERGPNMRPVRVESFAEFVETFGEPIPGKGGAGDAWREGNYTSPTYGVYAAQAYLKNSSPVTFVKLAGVDHVDKTSAATRAGYQVTAHSSYFGAAVDGSGPGAYGLFVAPSASAALDFVHAATFYVERGAIGLFGKTYTGGTMMTEQSGGQNVVVGNETDFASACFKMRVYDEYQADGSSTSATGSAEGDTSPNGLATDYIFNFDRNSEAYIRKVFNTDPVATNSNVVNSSGTGYKDFWLGQSFERSVQETLLADNFGSQTAADAYAVLMPLYQSAGSADGGDWRKEHTPAKTGWIISQNLGGTGSFDTGKPAVLSGSQSIPVTKLFRFHSLYGGEWEQNNLKISIRDLKKSSNQFDKYGSFTVEIRRADDRDAAPKVIETFSNCNLNPNSQNYVAAKIGDKFSEWDATEKRYKEYNTYPNVSRFIRVEMNKDVDTGQVDPILLPFGFYGPLKFAKITGVFPGSDLGTNSFARPAKAPIPFITSTKTGNTIAYGAGAHADITSSFEYPTLQMRKTTNTGGLSDATEAYFGVDTEVSGGGVFDHSYRDMIKALPSDIDVHGSPATGKVYSFIFTLDDIVVTGSHATWAVSQHSSGNSHTAQAGNTYDSLIGGKSFNRFTVPLVGGFDGLDIREKDPFNNSRIGSTETTHYAYGSVKRAIDSVSDPEVVECNLMAVPGIYKSGLTSHLIDTCERRADALAIIDLEGDFKPSSENTAAENASTRKASVSTTITNLRNRSLNSSYGATYFPWCTIHDTLKNARVNVPPSVVALGVLSYSQRNSELWFAPAGFTRGGLTENQAAGLPILDVKYALTSKDRDKLYDASINPIATFPNEGIVVFGQKTLQVTRSALDRINVRRLLIYLKKEVSRMSATLLFDQNVQATWDRFLAKVNPFLSSVKSRFGLTEFKVILDTTTTTPELIDRNIMYAKIFLKPARAIEFIALDFIITDSGASFEDL